MEVLERESRVLGARLLGDLSLHHRHHRRDPSLLLAPLAQRGGGARTEKLHLGAVAVQWMPGNEEPEHGLLAGEPFVLGQGRDIGVRGSGLGARGFFAEESVLAGLPFCLARLCLRKRRVQRGHQLGTMPAERVARARVDQRFDHALVAQPQVDALAQLH